MAVEPHAPGGQGAPRAGEGAALAPVLATLLRAQPPRPASGVSESGCVLALLLLTSFPPLPSFFPRYQGNKVGTYNVDDWDFEENVGEELT